MEEVVSLGASVECQKCHSMLIFECHTAVNVIKVKPCECVAQEAYEKLDRLKSRLHRIKNITNEA